MQLPAEKKKVAAQGKLECGISQWLTWSCGRRYGWMEVTS